MSVIMLKESERDIRQPHGLTVAALAIFAYRDASEHQAKRLRGALLGRTSGATMTTIAMHAKTLAVSGNRLHRLNY